MKTVNASVVRSCPTYVGSGLIKISWEINCLLIHGNIVSHHYFFSLIIRLLQLNNKRDPTAVQFNLW